jgi:hypothetical protein
MGVNCKPDALFVYLVILAGRYSENPCFLKVGKFSIDIGVCFVPVVIGSQVFHRSEKPLVIGFK